MSYHQIIFPYPCGTLSLKCGYLQSESSLSYESGAWRADSSKTLLYLFSQTVIIFNNVFHTSSWCTSIVSENRKFI